jgi:hypothetical protein
LENIKILVLDGIPKISKLFNFGLILQTLATFNSFGQHLADSGNVQPGLSHERMRTNGRMDERTNEDDGRWVVRDLDAL